MKRLLGFTLGLLCVSGLAAQSLQGPVSPFAGGGPREEISRSDSFVVRTDSGRTFTRGYAFSEDVAGPQAACVSNTTTLCLNGGRFKAQASWRVPSQGTSGVGTGVTLTGDTGYFWFFSSNNVELVLKVVDGRAFNNFFWVFFGALSDVEYTITVTDLVTGAVKTYTNVQGTLASVADTAAFASVPDCTYSIGTSSLSVAAGGGTGSVAVTAPGGCTWIATSNDSWITINSGTPGNGNGSVGFSVAANTGSGSRTGTLSVAGKTFTVTQAGANTGGGLYDGVWSGTTSQMCQSDPCGVTWTISNNNLVRFQIQYSGLDCGLLLGTTTLTYTPPRSINPASFNVTSTGSSDIRGDFNVNVVTNTTSTASGSGSVTVIISPPLGNCTTTNQITFTAVKS